MQDPMVRRAVAWLKRCSKPAAAGARRAAVTTIPSLAGQGTPTASQTAWALLALLAAGEEDSDTVRAGIDYLLKTQGEDGNWSEEQFTGTGFPKVFYLKYHLYRLYFPLMALARYRQTAKTPRTPSEDRERLDTDPSRFRLHRILSLFLLVFLAS